MRLHLCLTLNLTCIYHQKKTSRKKTEEEETSEKVGLKMISFWQGFSSFFCPAQHHTHSILQMKIHSVFWSYNSLIRKKQVYNLHLVQVPSALIKHFLKGSAPLRRRIFVLVYAFAMRVLFVSYKTLYLYILSCKKLLESFFTF